MAGVAIVFNLEVFESDNLGALDTFMHPVIYGPDEFGMYFQNLMIALRAHQDLLAQVPRDRAKSILFHAFQDLVLTTKHPGFGEEEEWRIIHSPFMFSSAYVMPSIHTIGGIPQVVHKIELKNQPNLNAPE